MFKKPLRAVIGVLAAVQLAGGGAAFAQSFPTRPIHLLVPFPAGASLDLLARTFAIPFDKHLGSPGVVVLNREGGSATVAMNVLQGAPADGYTIVYGTTTPLSVHPLWMKGLRYTKDSFIPVCQTFENVFVLASVPESPLVDVKAVAERARSKNGGVTYGHTGVAGAPHFAGAEFFQRAGIPALDVPFRGEAAVYPQMREGSVDLGVFTAAFVVNQKLRPLVVFADKRHQAFPDAPTARELGYPLIAAGVGGLFVRAETPAPIVAKVEEACNNAVKDPAFREMMQRLHQPPELRDRAGFAELIEADAKSKAELLKTVKIER